jgi:putative peptidoglycan lipid II flippase
MAPLLQLFVIGLPFFSVVNLTVRAFYAVKDTATPVKVAVIDFIANVILSLVLKQWLGAPGLVLASTTAIVLQTLLLQRALVRKLPGLSFAPLWPSVGKVLVATLAMSALVGGGWHWLAARGLGRVGDVIAIAGLIPAGVLLYGASLWLLKIEGRADFVELLTKLRGRFPPRNPPELQT